MRRLIIYVNKRCVAKMAFCTKRNYGLE